MLKPWGPMTSRRGPRRVPAPRHAVSRGALPNPPPLLAKNALDGDVIAWRMLAASRGHDQADRDGGALIVPLRREYEFGEHLGCPFPLQRHMYPWLARLHTTVVACVALLQNLRRNHRYCTRTNNGVENNSLTKISTIGSKLTCR